MNNRGYPTHLIQVTEILCKRTKENINTGT